MLALMSTVAISSSGSDSSVSVSIRCGLPFSSSVNDSFFRPRTKRPVRVGDDHRHLHRGDLDGLVDVEALGAPVGDQPPAVGQRRDDADVVLPHVASGVPRARPRRPLQRHSSRPSTVIEQRRRRRDRRASAPTTIVTSPSTGAPSTRLADGQRRPGRLVGVGVAAPLGMGARPSPPPAARHAPRRRHRAWPSVGRGSSRPRRNRPERPRRRQQPEVPLDARSDRARGRTRRAPSKSSAWRGAAVFTSSKVAEGIRSTTSIAGSSSVRQPDGQRQLQIRQGARHQPRASGRHSAPTATAAADRRSGGPTPAAAPCPSRAERFRQRTARPIPAAAISVIDRTPAQRRRVHLRHPAGQRLAERRRPRLGHERPRRRGVVDAAQRGRRPRPTAAASCRCASSVNRRRSSAATVVTSQRRSPVLRLGAAASGFSDGRRSATGASASPSPSRLPATCQALPRAVAISGGSHDASSVPTADGLVKTCRRKAASARAAGPRPSPG